MEHIGAAAVWELLNRYGIRLSKAMGQNFLVDGNITEKIVRMSGIGEGCGVLEVGPGFGSLTLELSRAAGRVVAVELDARLLPVLGETLAGCHNVEIVNADILKVDIIKLVNENLRGLTHHVCANLPYNITAPALTALIDAGIFNTITVMVQREVAARICAEPGSSDYGAFSVYVNYHTAPEKLFDVPPGCFTPQPKVWSSVVTMKRRAERLLPSEQEEVFFKVVRASFAQRRKTLVNALHSAFGNTMSKEEISEIVNKHGLDPRVRGETLGVESFVELSQYFMRIRYNEDT